jgi:hypothetical protein
MSVSPQVTGTPLNLNDRTANDLKKPTGALISDDFLPLTTELLTPEERSADTWLQVLATSIQL